MVVTLQMNRDLDHRYCKEQLSKPMIKRVADGRPTGKSYACEKMLNAQCNA
jgi:hypothetical protein